MENKTFRHSLLLLRDKGYKVAEEVKNLNDKQLYEGRNNSLSVEITNLIFDYDKLLRRKTMSDDENRILVIFKGSKSDIIDLVKDHGAYFFNIESDFIDLIEKLSERDDNSDVMDLIGV